MNTRSTNRIFLAAGLCFISFLFIYGLTARSDLQLSDEVAVFATGISWITDDSLAIDELQWIQNAVNIGAIGRGGHLYSKYFPGNIFSSALIYEAAKKQNDKPYLWGARAINPTVGLVELAPSNAGARLSMKLNAVFGALAMTSLLLLLKRYFDWKIAIITVLLMGLCTDWWYQSRGFLSEVGAGAFMITSLCFMVYQRPYYSAFSLGLSILFRPTNLIGLVIWGKAVYDKGLKAIWSGVFILASFSTLLLYNWIRFGSVLVFGYGGESFETNPLLGLAGLLFSPGRSIFLYSPILCLAIPGIWLFNKKQISLTIICTTVILVYTITISTWHAWHGGWTWGSRLLTPIVPILGIFLASALESARHNKIDLSLILILAVLGFGIQLLALSSDPVKNLVDSVIYGDIKYEDTIFTLENSWISLQLKSLGHWKFCDIDAYTLRQWFGNCQ